MIKKSLVWSMALLANNRWLVGRGSDDRKGEGGVGMITSLSPAVSSCIAA